MQMHSAARRGFALRLALCALCPSLAVAANAPAAARTPWLQLAADPALVAARYAVTVSGTPGLTLRHHTWHFYREPQRIALLKGAIDEIWQRYAQGQIRFERIFHDEQRIADYSAGELATLGVHTHWAELASFVDARSLAALRVASRSGTGANERVQLAGVIDGERCRVEWLPALQLPARLHRSTRAGAITDIRLVRHQALPAPAAWPQPGARSADYLRLDAADFGDMGYETVVRLSEALDVRLGWRKAHAHD